MAQRRVPEAVCPRCLYDRVDCECHGAPAGTGLLDHAAWIECMYCDRQCLKLPNGVKYELDERTLHVCERRGPASAPPQPAPPAPPARPAPKVRLLE